MLADSYKLFLDDASKIRGFRPGTKEERNDIEFLANEYVRAERVGNKSLQSSCISALMIRYWYMIPFLFDKSKSLRIDIEDVIGWLYDAFMKAFKYKSWLNTNKGVSCESNGAEKCINRCIDSVRQGIFQASNTDSRKLFYMTYSIEESVEKYGDASEALFIEDEDDHSGIKDLVDYKLKHNDVIGALIIDTISFNDCFAKSKFSTTKLISSLTPEYIASFKRRYAVSKSLRIKLDSMLTQKRKVINQVIKDKLANLQSDREMIHNAL